MSGRQHLGPWADSMTGAINAALAEVKVDVCEYVVCDYSDGAKLVPLAEGRCELVIEPTYSEAREQYRVRLREL
jgi:hypothetical protein